MDKLYQFVGDTCSGEITLTYQGNPLGTVGFMQSMVALNAKEPLTTVTVEGGVVDLYDITDGDFKFGEYYIFPEQPTLEEIYEFLKKDDQDRQEKVKERHSHHFPRFTI